MNRHTILGICAAALYIVAAPVTFFIFIEGVTYFATGAMLALALVMRLSRFRILQIGAAMAYLAAIWVDIMIFKNGYVFVSGIVLSIPLVMPMSKSSAIGLCAAVAYLATILVTFFVFDKFWAFMLEMGLAAPASLFNLQLCGWIGYLLSDIGAGSLLSLAMNIVWIYFLVMLLHSAVSAGEGNSASEGGGNTQETCDDKT